MHKIIRIEVRYGLLRNQRDENSTRKVQRKSAKREEKASISARSARKDSHAGSLLNELSEARERKAGCHQSTTESRPQYML